MKRPTHRASQRVPAMRTAVLMLALVFAASACSGKKNRQKPEAVVPVETGPTAQELFTKGNVDLDDGKWEAAIATYDSALEKDAKDWEVHMNRGIALSRLAKFADALSAFEASLRSGGEEQAIVYFNLGNLYQDRGLYSAAVDAYRAGLAYESPKKVDTLVNLGAAYIFLRQWDFANQTFAHVRQLAPDDARALHGQALVLQLQDKYKDAVDLYQQVHSIDPNFALAYFNAARCYAIMEDWNSAVRAIDDFVRLDPDSSVIRRAQGMQKRYREKAAGK